MLFLGEVFSNPKKECRPLLADRGRFPLGEIDPSAFALGQNVPKPGSVERLPY
jgi:hypothetical protein